MSSRTSPTTSTSRRLPALALCLCAALLAGAGCDDPTRAEPVAEVEVTAPATRVAVGQSIELSASVRSGSGAVITGRGVTWTSSNEAVATVASGRVTGKAPGVATITASAGGKQDRVEVTVEPAAPAVARVTVEPDSFLLVMGNSVTIQLPTQDHASNGRARVLAVPRDAAGAVLLWLPASFATSDAGVATVSESGVVRAVAPGTATITARIGGAEGRLTVTVERPYATVYLGTLPGLPESRAAGINDLGQVVGYAFAPPPQSSALGGARGWIWQDGRMTEVSLPDSLGAGLTVLPNDVNDRGQVGGQAISAAARRFAFLWEAGRTTVASLPWESAAVGGMNERGEMVGSWSGSPCARGCTGGAWIFRGGVVTPFGQVGPGDPLPRPSAINDRGQIAGTRRWPESEQAILLDSAAAAPRLLPTSSALSNASDIDEQGRVYGQDFDGSEIRAYVWSPAGGVTRFAPLRGGAISAPTRANDAGLAVGRSGCTLCPAELPVLFRGGKAVRIEDLFVPGDWVWEAATDINDRGKIVGYGTHRTTGARGALLLTPPAP